MIEYGCKTRYIFYNNKFNFSSPFQCKNIINERTVFSMTRDVRIAIDNIASLVRSAFGISVPVTDMDEVVRRIGGSVKESDDLLLIADGAVRKTEDDSFVILVSKNQAPARRNFTIAHEIGHLFLHMGYKINDELWAQQNSNPYYRNGTTQDEYQANEFAAAFLMPEQEYIEKLEELTENGQVNACELAAYFNVSIEAATNRGKFLNCIPW